MNAITYTEARENLAKTIRQVCRDHNPVIITRKREDSVVMISLEDYESLTETSTRSRARPC
jgi:antitoxin YefM